MLCGKEEAQLPPCRGQQGWIAVPPGWELVESSSRMTRQDKRDKNHFFFEMVDVAWAGLRKDRQSVQDWWDLCKATGFHVHSLAGKKKMSSPWGPFSVNKRLFLTAGGLLSEYKRMLGAQHPFGSWFFPPAPPRKVWRRVVERAPLFVKCVL